MSYSFDPTVLREYDIRGIVGQNLSEDDAYALGHAFGTYIQRQSPALADVYTVCVGFDGRLSSPTLSDKLCKGLSETGIRVINVGLGPTPMLYYAVKTLKADAGLMVTGSHNPSDYNGFKMTTHSYPIFGQKIQEIGKISASGDLIKGEGSVETLDIKDEYIDRLVADLELDESREFTIAWDAGNGAAGELMERLTQKIPGKHHLLFADIDGTFPNHHPDPTVDENLVDLQEVVAREKCDLGIAFDGDGDRIGVVDENGDVLRSDMLMTIYAKEVIESIPGAAVIGDVKCSQLMFDEVDRMGGKGVMWKTGHSLIKDKMHELNAPLAGELSGHIYFADKYYGFDDALYCAVRLLNAICAAKDNLSALTSHLPKVYSTPGLNVVVPEEDKFGLVERILEDAKTIVSADETMTLSDVDGVRVSTPDGWWLARASNTQNAIIARIEANSKEGLDRLVKMAGDAFEKIGYTLSV